jgi:predicted regulator of Ras-like GTPase activity (Roadblock/LC7/MglB family)
MPRPSQRAAAIEAETPTPPAETSHGFPFGQPAAAPAPPSGNGQSSAAPASAAAASGPLGSRLAQLRAKKQTGGLESAPVAMRLTPKSPGVSGKSYSDAQIELMRQALKDLALEPDVHCAVLADISGIVLTHWSRRRDINVTVVAALAAGNTMALAEISRNLGQQRPGHLVIHEGHDQSIIMASMGDLLLLIAIGPSASLGWARIATIRACEEVQRIAQGPM